MKKLAMLLMLLLAITVQSHHAFAQSVTITLMPGWNWISVPLMDTLDFETALGSFTPMQGDIIKSQWSNATYMGNGQWRGPISQFYPGYGYMYYSNRPMPVMVTFTTQQPVPQVIVTTAEPTDITATSAISGGSITSNDGSYVFVLEKGICWATHPDPTFNDNYVVLGNGIGSFTVSVTDLTPSTECHVRAFAVTAIGTYYGNEISFTTDNGWVDLGLPSGTLWAICNVGANSPEDYGDYFAWGETEPKNYYNWSNYQYCNGSSNMLTKYCNSSSYGYNGYTDDLISLEPIDDAASSNWGENWYTPTYNNWVELYQNTTIVWTTQNGVNGLRFTGSNGNNIFIPAAGYYDDANLSSTGSYGLYWSSSLRTEYPSGSWCLDFNSGYYNSGYYGMCSYGRKIGTCVRPVRNAE